MRNDRTNDRSATDALWSKRIYDERDSTIQARPVTMGGVGETSRTSTRSAKGSEGISHASSPREKGRTHGRSW